MGVDWFGFFQTHCYPEIKDHMVRMYETAEFYESISQLPSNKVTAFVFKLVCPFIGFQIWVGLGFFSLLKNIMTKPIPTQLKGAQKRVFLISASSVLTCLGLCHHYMFSNRKSSCFLGTGRNGAE